MSEAGAMRKEIREFKEVKDKRLRLLQQLRATCCLRVAPQPSCALALSCSYAAFVHDSVFVATQWLFVHAPHAFVLALRVFVLLCNLRAAMLLSWRFTAFRVAPQLSCNSVAFVLALRATFLSSG